MRRENQFLAESLQGLESGKLSRRQFIKRAMVLGLSMAAISELLAGCAPAATPTPAPTAPPTPTPPPAPTPTPAPSPTPGLEEEVNVVAWAQEWEHAVEPFQEEYGVKVNMTMQGAIDETISLLQASPNTFDVVSFGPFDWPLIGMGLIQPYDLSRLEHWEELHPFFREMLTTAWEGEVYNIPYYWGSSPLARNTELIPEPIDSWGAMWDPKYKGMVAVMDQSTEMYAVLSLYLGLDINEVTESNMEKCREAMLELAENMKTFWATGDDIKTWLAAGEIALSQVWDGTGRALMVEGYPIELTYPKEGLRGWIDGPGIMVGAPHPNAAYAWINFVTSPEIEAEMTKMFWYSPANMKALDLLDEETKRIVQANQVDEMLSTGFFLHRLTAEQILTLSEWWTDLHAEIGA